MNAQGNGGRGERDVLCYHSQLHSGCCEEELLPLLLGGDAARMERVIWDGGIPNWEGNGADLCQDNWSGLNLTSRYFPCLHFRRLSPF